MTNAGRQWGKQKAGLATIGGVGAMAADTIRLAEVLQVMDINGRMGAARDGITIAQGVSGFFSTVAPGSAGLVAAATLLVNPQGNRTTTT